LGACLFSVYIRGSSHAYRNATNPSLCYVALPGLSAAIDVVGLGEAMTVCRGNKVHADKLKQNWRYSDRQYIVPLIGLLRVGYTFTNLILKLFSLTLLKAVLDIG
jgi:hypothetical protein